MEGKPDVKGGAVMTTPGVTAPLTPGPAMMMWTASPLRHQSAKTRSLRDPEEVKPSMKEFSRIGVDLAKGFFQVHALEREGAPAVRGN
jgi:hypothetical protein